MRSHHPVARLCAAAALLAASDAAAQEIALNGNAQAELAAQHPAGAYAGVKPGGNQQPVAQLKPGSPAVITWPGFQMQPDGSSRVFVQVTAPVDTSAAVVDGKVVVDFGNTPIATTTNRLPIYPKFFNTPVTALELKRAKKSTVLELTLRSPIQPRISSETAASGYFFVYIDFPEGDFLPAGMASAAPSAPPPPSPPTTDLNAPPEPPGTVQSTFEASGSANASGDAELPPGMGKLKAGGKAKASGKAKGKASISF